MTTMLRPYKFVIQAIVQVVDGDGRVVDEQISDPVTKFGCDALAEWAMNFPRQLAEKKES